MPVATSQCMGIATFGLGWLSKAGSGRVVSCFLAQGSITHKTRFGHTSVQSKSVFNVIWGRKLVNSDTLFFFPTQFKHQGQKQGYLVSLCNFDDGLFIAGVHSRESLATDSVHKLIVDETLKQRQKIFFLINFQKGLLWSFSNWKSTFLIKSARSVLMCPMAYWKCT